MTRMLTKITFSLETSSKFSKYLTKQVKKGCCHLLNTYSVIFALNRVREM